MGSFRIYQVFFSLPSPPPPSLSFSLFRIKKQKFACFSDRLANNIITKFFCVIHFRSLAEHSIPVQHYLHELVITTLVQRKAYYQLHQLLQYHVVADSKPLACLLLSLENLYPAAHQLALDMLKRLGNAHEEIIEVLLSKGYILPALR